ncbi:hypothetical protein Nmel_004923 [Mimus melanotis]
MEGGFHLGSLRSSVEAQCGLVLNGQGGVIRRGKRLQILASISFCKHTSLSISPCLFPPSLFSVVWIYCRKSGNLPFVRSTFKLA